jgi:hypothetical protein
MKRTRQEKHIVTTTTTITADDIRKAFSLYSTATIMLGWVDKEGHGRPSDHLDASLEGQVCLISIDEDCQHHAAVEVK